MSRRSRPPEIAATSRNLVMETLLIEIRYPNGKKETGELRDPRET
ncbi:MAG TPA: hypothetical protein PLI18_19110 [Pirellulaceae bacterium]|nr:hypothetical protein [Pirellulaceae bacterium]